MKFKFSLALLLSAIILASSASATLISTSVVGGVESEAQNGGTSGMVANSGANYYQLTANTPFIFSPTGDGLNTGFLITPGFQDLLTEYVGVNAHVIDGKTGTASASFDTKTAQPFTFTDPNVGNPVVTSTSLNGAISVAVTKTSNDGVADANAYMLAQSGGDYHTIGTQASLDATESLSGVGSAVAQVSQATATSTATYGTVPVTGGIYSKSSVTGDIKLTASNADDSALATNGGAANGHAHIEAASYESYTGQGEGLTDETMTLHANRAQSFTGRSYADGYLNGQEMTESQWAPTTLLGTTATTVVDLESTSQITGSVVALNIRDIANLNAYLHPYAQTWTNGEDYAHVDWNAIAAATRDTPYSGTAKVEANGYMPIATWIASASTTSPTVQRLAIVKGMQGKAWDGVPSVNSGFGVGAWILNSYNPAQTAQMRATQTAYTVPTTYPASATFQMTLNGMSTITGTQKDAVGAFGAVANQFIQVKRTDAAPAISITLKPLDTNAINWLVGDDANMYPGSGKVSPINMPFTSSTNGIQRTATLTYIQP
jgi:hypothetical protein